MEKSCLLHVTLYVYKSDTCNRHSFSLLLVSDCISFIERNYIKGRKIVGEVDYKRKRCGKLEKGDFGQFHLNR